jgi:GTP-dependent phosphoenolpyruvate carboxykinase
MKQGKSSIAKPPTTNKHLIRWVEKMAELTQPAAIHWVDGSQAEYDWLCDELVASGTFIRLNQEVLLCALGPAGCGAGGGADVYLLALEGQRRADQ